MRIALDSGAFAPKKAHEADGGYDLYAPEDATVYNTRGTIINTGVHVEIPKGYVGLIKSRSGLNIRQNIICEGVIDSGYTGSIVVKLRLMTDLQHEWVRINRGDRIAQLVIVPFFSEWLEVVNELDDTDRGTNGFGSSGR